MAGIAKRQPQQTKISGTQAIPVCRTDIKVRALLNPISCLQLLKVMNAFQYMRALGC